MTTTDQLVEQKIKEHESRLKHIDELMNRAESEGVNSETAKEELADIKKQRKKMGDYVQELKQKSPQKFMESAGPMVMWEIVAEKLEHLIEKKK